MIEAIMQVVLASVFLYLVLKWCKALYLRIRPKIKRIQLQWDSRLGTLVNSFLAVGSFFDLNLSVQTITEDDDPKMLKHVRALREKCEKDLKQMPSTKVDRVEDIALPRSDGGNVHVRLYYPFENKNNQPRPWTLFFHGGGWVVQSIQTHDAFCRHLAKESGFVVASVEYRLSPEVKYPIPQQDCCDALNGLHKEAKKHGLDATRGSVAGDSAGGYLAALVALYARDHNIPLRMQLLLCPAVDPMAKTPSYDENKNFGLLPPEDMRWFWRRYLPSTYFEDGDNSASLLAISNLKGVAPAVVVAAEVDILRDEAEQYANSLKQAGVPTDYNCYPGTIHDFILFAKTFLSKGDIALKDAALALQNAMK